MIRLLVLVGFVGALVIGTSISRSQSNEQPIAWCQQIAEGNSKSMNVPIRAGAIDSRGWPNYHPCKNLYFERECRQAAYAQIFRGCILNMQGR